MRMSAIPLFGELYHSRSIYRWAALKELLVCTMFSTLPLWFFPAISWIFIENSPNAWDIFILTLSKGELYIYSCALVGPLIFAIMKRYGSWGDESPSTNASRLGKMTFEFPYGVWFVVISILICIFSALFFGLTRFSEIGLISISWKEGPFLWASSIIYLFCLLCLFSVSVYRNELENLSTQDSSDMSNFLDAWNSRNGN